jgi:UDP-perosamine 4-acetyltransferase
MKPIIIIGGGGHAKVIASTIRALGHSILGFTDPNERQNDLFGIVRLGNDAALSAHHSSHVLLVNGIGCTRPGSLRASVFHKFKNLGYSFATLIHPSAFVAAEANIGEGSVVFAGAVVQAGVSIGRNAIINTKASVDHDSNIGDHVHLAPGVVISGGVKIGDDAHIGVGATLIQGITIGTGVMVGAGAVVLRDTPPHSTVWGVPARIINPPDAD